MNNDKEQVLVIDSGRLDEEGRPTVVGEMTITEAIARAQEIVAATAPVEQTVFTLRAPQPLPDLSNLFATCPDLRRPRDDTFANLGRGHKKCRFQGR